MNLILGIDIGGTNTKLALLDQSGTVKSFKRFSTQEYLTYEKFLPQLVWQIQNFFMEGITIQGIGIGAPNGNAFNGFVEDPPNLPWGRVDLCGDLRRKLNLSIKTPILLENDANLAALAEGHFGVAVNCKDYIVMTLGTGVGTGVVCEGHLIHGATGLAGEGGHTTVMPKGRLCGCGVRGHLEAYAGSAGIRQTVLEIFGQEEGREHLDLAKLAHQAKGGDARSLLVFRQSAEWIGIALANMVAVTLPRLVILSGGVAAAGEFFCQMVEEEMQKNLFSPFRPVVKLLHAGLPPEEGAVLGAVSLVNHFMQIRRDELLEEQQFSF